MLTRLGFRWLTKVTYLAVVAMVVLAATTVRAAPSTLYSIGGQAGGNWTDAYWSTTGSAPYSSGWVDGDDARFQAGSGTITVGSISLCGISFQPGYTLSGGTITLTGDTSPFNQSDWSISAAAAVNSISMGGGSNTATINSVLAGSGGMNKLGGGTIVLGGANTFTGVTSFSGGGNGTLKLGNPLALQNSTLNYSAGTVDLSGLSSATFGGLSGSTDLALPSNFGLTIGSAGDSDSTTYSGALSGSNVTLSKAGAGELTLKGSANTYTGTLEVNGGDVLLWKTAGQVSATGDIHLNTGISTPGNGSTLCPITAGQIASTSTITFNPGTGQYAVFNMHGYDQTVAGISDTTGRGVIQNGDSAGGGMGNTATLTVNNTTDCSYNGIIQNYWSGADSSVALVKAGTGTLTLGDSTHDSIGFKGGLTVNGGTLKMGSARALGDTAASNTLLVNSGGAIDVNGQSPGAYPNALTINGTGVGGTGALLDSSGGSGGNGSFRVVLASDSTIGVAGAGSLTIGALSGTGALTKVSSGDLVLDGADTYTGATQVSAGTLTLGISGSALMDINPSVAPTEQFLGTGILAINGTLKLDVTDITGNSGSWMLVDMATLASGSSYGGSFAVTMADGTPFVDSSGVWTYAADGKSWSFSESTGMLTLGVVPEPGTLGLLATGLVWLLAYARRKGR